MITPMRWMGAYFALSFAYLTLGRICTAAVIVSTLSEPQIRWGYIALAVLQLPVLLWPRQRSRNTLFVLGGALWLTIGSAPEPLAARIGAFALAEISFFVIASRCVSLPAEHLPAEEARRSFSPIALMGAIGCLLGGALPLLGVDPVVYPALAFGTLVGVLLLEGHRPPLVQRTVFPETTAQSGEGSLALVVGLGGLLVFGQSIGRVWDQAVLVEAERAALSATQTAQLLGRLSIGVSVGAIALLVLRVPERLFARIGFAGVVVGYPVILTPIVAWLCAGGGVAASATGSGLDLMSSDTTYGPARSMLLSALSPPRLAQLMRVERTLIRTTATLAPSTLLLWGATESGLLFVLVLLHLLTSAFVVRALGRRLRARAPLDPNARVLLDSPVFRLRTPSN